MEDKKELIQKIIDQIILYSNLSGMDEYEEYLFRKNIEAQINQRLGIIILSNLNEEGLRKYEDLTKENEIADSKKIEELIIKYIPDYQEKQTNQRNRLPALILRQKDIHLPF